MKRWVYIRFENFSRLTVNIIHDFFRISLIYHNWAVLFNFLELERRLECRICCDMLDTDIWMPTRFRVYFGLVSWQTIWPSMLSTTLVCNNRLRMDFHQKIRIFWSIWSLLELSCNQCKIRLLLLQLWDSVPHVHERFQQIFRWKFCKWWCCPSWQ